MDSIQQAGIKKKEVIDSLEERFKENYQRGKEDGTLRTDIPEKEMFSATLHLMMAAATRYAVGLICDAGVAPEKELELLKDMLMQRFTVKAEEIQTTP